MSTIPKKASITTSAVLAQILAMTMPLCAATSDWDPSTSPTLRSDQPQDLLIHGRAFELYQHGVRSQWGYQKPQQDIFVVVHPKNERKNAPLYVVLHSAGHDVIAALKCTNDVGNHDIYRSPDDFYALYLDCRANMGDWWWGGMHLGDAELTRKNSGADPMPVERRVLDSIKWVMAKYNIDRDTQNKLEMALLLVTPADLKTTFKIPGQATADVSLRRIQNGQIKPGGAFQWTFGTAKGAGKADADGLITIAGLTITSVPTKLTVTK